MSVYDIADHPDFRFRTTDIVIRIGNSDGATAKEDEVGSQHTYVTMLSPGTSLGTLERVSGRAMTPHAHILGILNSLAC